MDSGAGARDSGAARLNDIATLLHVLTKKVDALDTKVDAMAAKLNDVVAAHASTTEGVSRMTGHIDFVEDVYDTLRHPLSRLTGLVRRQELPAPPGSHPQSAQ
mgnify:CR=1 FL=1